MKPIISSILDNDLYKFTMLNAVLKLYPGKKVEYKFYNRDKRPLPPSFYLELRRQISYLDKLRLTQIEEAHLRSTCSHLFDEEFFFFLNNFRFDFNRVSIKVAGEEISIIIKGAWEDTILYEVPVMAIISELFFQLTGEETSMSQFKLDTARKGEILLENNIPFMEFGTRRRYSKLAQSLAISILKMTAKSSFLGTSNVYFSMIHNVPVLGTVAHEWIMYHGATVGYKDANTASVEAWKKVYGKELNVALPDTYTSKVFYETMDKELLSTIGSVRQDSGEPNDFTDLSILYFGGNSEFITILYSDGLNVDKVLRIDAYRKGEIKKKYCLGTSFTNDFKGIKPLNIVIKLDKVEGIPTVKLSDTSGKHTGEPEAIEKCLKELELC